MKLTALTTLPSELIQISQEAHKLQVGRRDSSHDFEACPTNFGNEILYTEFHGNPANYLVSDTNSKKGYTGRFCLLVGRSFLLHFLKHAY